MRRTKVTARPPAPSPFPPAVKPYLRPRVIPDGASLKLGIRSFQLWSLNQGCCTPPSSGRRIGLVDAMWLSLFSGSMIGIDVRFRHYNHLLDEQLRGYRTEELGTCFCHGCLWVAPQIEAHGFCCPWRFTSPDILHM